MPWAVQCVLSPRGPDLITASCSAPVPGGPPVCCRVGLGCLGAKLTLGKEHLWLVWATAVP